MQQHALHRTVQLVGRELGGHTFYFLLSHQAEYMRTFAIHLLGEHQVHVLIWFEPVRFSESCQLRRLLGDPF